MTDFDDMSAFDASDTFDALERKPPKRVKRVKRDILERLDLDIVNLSLTASGESPWVETMKDARDEIAGMRLILLESDDKGNSRR